MRMTLLGWTGCLAIVALPVLTTNPVVAQASLTPAQRQAAQACRADTRTHCAAVERGDGRIVACLRANAEKLSPACRDALDTLPR